MYLAVDSTFAARGDSWRCIGGGGGDALGRGTVAGTSGGISGGVFALVGGEAGREGRFLSLLDEGPSCSAAGSLKQAKSRCMASKYLESCMTPI